MFADVAAVLDLGPKLVGAAKQAKVIEILAGTVADINPALP